MSFEEFWTNENNPSLPKSEYLYGTRHIIVLILTVIACVAFTLIFYKRSERAKRILFKVFASILLFFEVTSRIVNLIIAESLNFEEIMKILLPMHMCSVMVWVFIIAIFTKKQVLLNYGVIGGLLATIAFLLYPAVGLNKVYMSFTCIYSVFSHMLGFITVILLMTLKQVRFEFKKIWQPFVCFAIMFAWGVLLNWVIFPGSDYMYLRNDPLELGLSFPYHILYGIIIVLYTCLFYLINFIIDKVKTKRLAAAANKTDKI
ncbi:MAG: YwaF family protein [Clostridia bacterium]|nr:YwaF family protein [Clostridia bacterium]